MFTPTSRSHRRVSGWTELLGAIPYLLGFHPAESLVLVGLQDGVLVVTARLDLADTERPGLVHDTVAALHRGGVRQLVAIVVDDGCVPPTGQYDDLPRADVVVQVDEAAALSGIELADALLLGRGRWWSYLCGAGSCCPPEGTPLSDAPSAFAAEAAYEGVVALPDRAALAETLEPLPEHERAAVTPLISAAEHAGVAAVLDDRGPAHERALVRELLRAARDSDDAQWQVPDDAAAARLAVALGAIEIRDRVWLDVDSRRVDGRRLWAELARRCPAPYDAAPLFLFGWASWRAGNGALAGMAAERALAGDPGYSAADLLLAALNQAIDPRSFPLLQRSELAGRVRARQRPGRRGGAARTRR